jgi:hypothetical protein
MEVRIRMKKQVSVLNLRSHSISTFNRYDRRSIRIGKNLMSQNMGKVQYDRRTPPYPFTVHP